MPIFAHRKKIKKDYQRQNSPNPFFHRRGDVKKKHLDLRWPLALVFLAFIFLVWFFLAAPFWRIQDIRISGLTRAPEGEVSQIIWTQSVVKRWGIFNESNIFLFDSLTASKKIIAQYNVAGAVIKKIWPRTLAVQISERPYAFIFKEGSALFYASADAYAIKQPPVSLEDQKKYFILENKGPNTLLGDNNQISLPANYLAFVMALNSALSRYSDLPVTEFIMDQDLNTVQVKFSKGPVVYFNVNDMVKNQLDILLLVKNDKIKDNFKRTDYIDLRYGNRVFISPEFN